MAVIRVIKNGNYTVMSNTHLRDQSLSLKAIGLLSKMLSLPEDWDYSVAGLACICMESRNTINGVLKELEASGYLRREQQRTEGGSFAGYDYTLYERPEPELQIIDRSSIISPYPKKRDTVNPYPVNEAQLNKDRLITDELNPPKAPRGARECKEAPDWNPERFSRLWDYYPRKQSKQAAIRAWDKLKPTDALIDTIARALRRQVSTDDWQRNIGIPYLATYLNNRRWEDEPDRLPYVSEMDTGWAPDEEVY